MQEQTINIGRKISFVLAMILSLIVALLISGGSVSAQGADSEENSDSAETSETYKYTAMECDNLTVLARRSIQLEDLSNDEVELSNAAVIYAENTLVSMSNPHHLAIGEMVSFDSSQVQDVVSQASNLSSDALAAWQVYADMVDFTTTEAVMPSNTPTGVEVPNSDQGETSSADADEGSTDDVAATDEGEDGDDPNDDDTPWYWWVIGAGAIGGVWYLLWNRTEEE